MDTGYQGRKGIYELLLIDEYVAPLILKNADAQSIKQVAMEQGMDSLRDDGSRKVMEGTTSVAEVLGATQEDVAAVE
jgi:general secretion pathway protein E